MSLRANQLRGTPPDRSVAPKTVAQADFTSADAFIWQPQGLRLAPVPLVNGDMRADIEALARRMPPAAVLRVCDTITTTRRRLTQNAALPLALEGMTVRLGETT